jgi:hypothetical protein
MVQQDSMPVHLKAPNNKHSTIGRVKPRSATGCSQDSIDSQVKDAENVVPYHTSNKKGTLTLQTLQVTPAKYIKILFI